MGVCGDKILILDDEEGLRYIVTEELRSIGYDAYGMSSKADGLEWISEHKPDLVITDINSPDLNGFEFLSLLRADAAISHTKVIVVSGLNVPDEVAEADGILDYLTKPYQLDVLLGVIKEALSN